MDGESVGEETHPSILKYKFGLNSDAQGQTLKMFYGMRGTDDYQIC